MNERIIAEAERWAKEKLGGDSSGHDWWHIERVRRMAVRLARRTGADGFVCEMAALLHDLADEKLFGDEEAGLRDIRRWLGEQGVDEGSAERIVDIIARLSFKGGGRASMPTLEGQVVQDADRLDALGAVGIARTFAYSGWKGQPMHDPALPPREAMTAEEYRKGKSTAYNHFHEKLLKLKAFMNTEEARRIAEERHRYMESFLARFEAEWNGTDEA
ncbi:HD domain-containing protein [Paenibacillus sp.]|uniref:HD domain-containing protein n=1 Tax=Paenibacillus sp. TaxID=58172 RepID=UPI002D73E394|nr:HD domain-containing protein [Paenibacillus sp.]HZG56070.1 HD domain-containing protein [Paenibacillus sp.]